MKACRRFSPIAENVVGTGACFSLLLMTAGVSGESMVPRSTSPNTPEHPMAALETTTSQRIVLGFHGAFAHCSRGP